MRGETGLDGQGPVKKEGQKHVGDDYSSGICAYSARGKSSDLAA